MQSWSRKDAVKAFFFVFSLIGALFFWFAVKALSEAVSVYGWSGIIFSFCSFFVSWSLVVLLESSRKNIFLLSLLISLMSLFVFSGIFIWLSVLPAILFFYLSGMMIYSRLRERIKFDVFTSLYFAKRVFVLAVMVVVVGGFLLPITLKGENAFFPQFKITKRQIGLLRMVIPFFDKNVSRNDLSVMTVDQYILKHQKDVLARGGDYSVLMGGEQKMVLEMERRSLSEVVGRTLHGNELIMDVFVEIINKRINDYFNINLTNRMATLKGLFVLISAFVVYSIGSFLVSLSTFVVAFIFKVLLWSGLLKIKLKTVEAEVIE